jgi:hypothetical protein
MKTKKLLLIGLALMLLTSTALVASTYLKIDQPVSAAIRIEGIGNSPTFNVIDNPDAATAGGRTGSIQGNDTYLMNFGPGGGGVVFGRNQAVQVGSTDDPIFTLQNNYAKNVIVRMKSAQPDGKGGPPVGGNGFYMRFYSPTIAGDPWPYHNFGVWVQTYNRIGSQGAHLLPPGQSRSYYMQYTTYGGAAQPEQNFTLPLQFEVMENEEPLLTWAQKNLPANDVLFDDVNQVVYHKTADGSSVEIIPFANFDYDAWLASWPAD